MTKQTATIVLALATRTAATEPAASSDRDLLRRFAESGDQAAFAALVNRHGGMVLGVCRRVLHSQEDAEDACQAVFLVLARKAATRWQASVANWLYATARKVAQNARLGASRRAKREGSAALGSAALQEAMSPADAMTVRELGAVLDEELERLAPRYRAPLVLCYLEGLTRDEAAVRLGVPLATLKSQLERGRKKLADALTTRGCVLGVALTVVATSSPVVTAVPLRLFESILVTVGGSPSDAVVALAKGVAVKSVLTVTKLVVLVVVGAVAGFGFFSAPMAASPRTCVPGKLDKFSEPDKPLTKHENPKSEMKERTITGKVVGAGGKPLVAELSLVWQEGKPQPLGKTSADGTFKLSVPFNRGEHGGWLVATALGCGPDFQPHGMEHLPRSMTPTAEITLKLPKERAIKGRILDQQGKPVVGATVAAISFAASDSDAAPDTSLEGRDLKSSSLPGGGGSLEFADGFRGRTNADVVSPYAATTDKAGRFEITGVGANQKIHLSIRGAGLADEVVVTVNREGFDPAPINEARNEMKRFTSSGGDRSVWYGPDPTVVVEPEKIIRGRVTDPAGKPRVGVQVWFSRTSPGGISTLIKDYNTALTDRDGKYEIRGARKHKHYGVEAPSDVKAGLLPCQGFADDTVGYEPITIDLKCAKGVVVTGTVKNKATGAPVSTQMFISVLSDNPFVEKYPPFLHAASLVPESSQTDAAGKFQVVTIPGPVVLMAMPLNGEMGHFKQVIPDLKYADRFTTDNGGLDFRKFGGISPVKGCWCKVIEAKATDAEITVDVELEPAPTTLVKVVDADGKPVTEVKAAGITHVDLSRATACPDTDTLTVYNLEPKKERLLAVIHGKRKLVGTLLLTGDDKNPVMKLGSGGTVTGRAVDKDGKPLAGLSVRVYFERREAMAAFDARQDIELVTTDANGVFSIDGLFPGQEFRLNVSKGLKRFGPDNATTPKHIVAKHGDTLKLGDWKFAPTPMTDREE